MLVQNARGPERLDGVDNVDCHCVIMGQQMERDHDDLMRVGDFVIGSPLIQLAGAAMGIDTLQIKYIKPEARHGSDWLTT